MRSPAVVRSQLWSSHPISEGQSPILQPVVPLLLKASLDGALPYTQAVDALMLVQHGTERQQQRLVQQGRMAYHCALQRVGSELSQAVERNAFPDELSVASYMLFVDSLFTTLASAEGSMSSISHLRGTISILRRTAGGKHPTALQLQLLDNCIQPLWILSLCTRQPMPIRLSSVEQAGLARIGRFSDLTADLADLPGMLATLDSLEIDDDAGRKTLLRQVAQFGAKVSKWLQKKQAEVGQAFTTAPVYQYPSFDARLDELSMDLFKVAYCWSSLLEAWTYACAWIALLATKILRLHLAADRSDVRGPILEAGSELAAHMCKTIIFELGVTHARGKTEAYAQAGALIPFVTRWYIVANDPARLEWCARAREVIHAAGITTISDVRVQGVRAPLNA